MSVTMPFTKDESISCEHGVWLKNRCLKCNPIQVGDHTPDLNPRLPLPQDSAARKEVPMATGLLDYFTAALAEVAHVSYLGNQKHNPGQALHWARGKSMDHADCIVRHLAERGGKDPAGVRHTAQLAWRALALLQEELEAEYGLPMSRGSKPAT